jgi:hypothetical protein
MAHSQSCDACGKTETERYKPGWGSLNGTDSLGQYVQKDLCPRCSSLMQLALGELRKRLTAPAVVAARSPSPPPSQGEEASGFDLSGLLSQAQDRERR